MHISEKLATAVRKTTPWTSRWLLCGLVGLGLLGTRLPAPAYSATDVATSFNAFNTAFYTASGTNGYIKNTQTGGVTYFWGQAEEIECVIDTYEWTSNSACKGMITNLLNGFLTVNGSNWSWDIYNDDIMWAVMAFARGGQDTGLTNYCQIAEANFDATFARAWSSSLGGGLFWNTDDASKNACVEGPASIAASLMYRIYGTANYLADATNIYNWERSVLFNTNTGAIYDNIGTNGAISTWSSSYNQGTFLGAANFLGQTNDATLAANYSMMYLTSGGILPEYGIAGNNSGFNAIFLRWLTRFMREHNLQSTYEPWLQLNANAAWNVRRAADNLSWCQWLQPSPAGTNFYSWDCISSFEAMEAATPAQTNSPLLLPVDLAGSWPLDATSGLVAADVSGHGNNGVVNGAAWSTSGRINGCLTFNGLNSDVQIGNSVSNDFSIAFWVKTTQTAGTGQWYKGAGLVDGDAPGTANDFGTALVGGKFAFGVGNPDTTFTSTTPINDGNWHQCVATRQQGTGAVNLYVDGVLQTTGVANENTLNAQAHLLFGAIESGGGYFKGSLDAVQIFNHPLSGTEVAALYASCQSVAPAPASVTALGRNGQVNLNWWEASGAGSYNVKRSLLDGGPYTTITNVTTSAFTDTNVVRNHTYYYVVSAVNTAGEGTNSVPVSANPAGLLAWFRADTLAGLASGAPLAAWPDSSGNGFAAQQPLTAQQPAYVAGAMNGLPVVRFNSAASTYMWFYPPVQNDFTIFVVYQSSQKTQGTGTAFWNGAGLVNGDQSGTANDFGMSLNANGQFLAGTGNPDISVGSGSGYNNGKPHVLTFRRTMSSGALALFIDGLGAASGAGGINPLNAPPDLWLGAVPSGGGFFTGDIAEVQIYNAALANADIVAYANALKCKYGLTGTDPATPAGLTATTGNREVSLAWTLSSGATGYNLWRSTNSGVSYQSIAAGVAASSYIDTNAASGLTNYYEVTSTDACGSSTAYASLRVFLPQPALALAGTTNSVLTLNWPAWASDWVLSAATNLSPPVLWLPVTNAVGSNNGQFNVTLPMDSANRFFRLSSP